MANWFEKNLEQAKNWAADTAVSVLGEAKAADMAATILNDDTPKQALEIRGKVEALPDYKEFKKTFDNSPALQKLMDHNPDASIEEQMVAGEKLLARVEENPKLLQQINTIMGEESAESHLSEIANDPERKAEFQKQMMSGEDNGLLEALATGAAKDGDILAVLNKAKGNPENLSEERKIEVIEVAAEIAAIQHELKDVKGFEKFQNSMVTPNGEITPRGNKVDKLIGGLSTGADATNPAVIMGKLRDMQAADPEVFNRLNRIMDAEGFDKLADTISGQETYASMMGGDSDPKAMVSEIKKLDAQITQDKQFLVKADNFLSDPATKGMAQSIGGFSAGLGEGSGVDTLAGGMQMKGMMDSIGPGMFGQMSGFLGGMMQQLKSFIGPILEKLGINVDKLMGNTKKISVSNDGCKMTDDMTGGECERNGPDGEALAMNTTDFDQKNIIKTPFDPNQSPNPTLPV